MMMSAVNKVVERKCDHNDGMVKTVDTSGAPQGDEITNKIALSP